MEINPFENQLPCSPCRGKADRADRANRLNKNNVPKLPFILQPSLWNIEH